MWQQAGCEKYARKSDYMVGTPNTSSLVFRGLFLTLYHPHPPTPTLLDLELVLARGALLQRLHTLHSKDHLHSTSVTSLQARMSNGVQNNTLEHDGYLEVALRSSTSNQLQSELIVQYVLCCGFFCDPNFRGRREKAQHPMASKEAPQKG